MRKEQRFTSEVIEPIKDEKDDEDDDNPSDRRDSGKDTEKHL